MHWFVWLLIILCATNIGLTIAKLGGYKPTPSNAWISLILESLLLAGIIAYLT